MSKEHTKPFFKNELVEIYHGDCREVLPMLGSQGVSFTSVVTDPPYGEEFMRIGWDFHVPGREYWSLILEHCAPGAYLFAFSGNRTWHRLYSGAEDAGWSIKDTLMWIYSTGFHKSRDVSLEIDKRAGLIGEDPIEIKQILISLFEKSGKRKRQIDAECGFKASSYLALPAEGKKYDPWVRLLPTRDKWEKIKRVLGEDVISQCNAIDRLDSAFSAAERELVARKTKARKSSHDFALPTQGNTVYKTFDVTAPASPEAVQWHGYGTSLKPCWEPIMMAMKPAENTYGENAIRHGVAGLNLKGSAPKTNLAIGCACENAAHSEDCAAGMLDNQGEGASRFFYCAKAAPGEKGRGNVHPTVKPIKLMGWILGFLRMPHRTLIVDPFMGSGSTLVAAQAMGVPIIGIDKDRESCAIAAERVKEARNMSLPLLFEDNKADSDKKRRLF